MNILIQKNQTFLILGNYMKNREYLSQSLHFSENSNSRSKSKNSITRPKLLDFSKSLRLSGNRTSLTNTINIQPEFSLETLRVESPDDYEETRRPLTDISHLKKLPKKIIPKIDITFLGEESLKLSKKKEKILKQQNFHFPKITNVEENVKKMLKFQNPKENKKIIQKIQKNTSKLSPKKSTKSHKKIKKILENEILGKVKCGKAICGLPNEILLNIFYFLNDNEIIHIIPKVCSDFKHAIDLKNIHNNQIIFKFLFQRLQAQREMMKKINNFKEIKENEEKKDRNLKNGIEVFSQKLKRKRKNKKPLYLKQNFKEKEEEIIMDKEEYIKHLNIFMWRNKIKNNEDQEDSLEEDINEMKRVYASRWMHGDISNPMIFTTDRFTVSGQRIRITLLSFPSWISFGVIFPSFYSSDGEKSVNSNEKFENNDNSITISSTNLILGRRSDSFGIYCTPNDKSSLLFANSFESSNVSISMTTPLKSFPFVGVGDTLSVFFYFGQPFTAPSHGKFVILHSPRVDVTGFLNNNLKSNIVAILDVKPKKKHILLDNFTGMFSFFFLIFIIAIPSLQLGVGCKCELK